MGEQLDLYAIRKSANKSITHPDWLIEGAIVYSKRYKRNLKVKGILGDCAFLELENQIINEPISDLASASLSYKIPELSIQALLLIVPTEQLLTTTSGN